MKNRTKKSASQKKQPNKKKRQMTMYDVYKPRDGRDFNYPDCVGFCGICGLNVCVCHMTVREFEKAFILEKRKLRKTARKQDSDGLPF